MMKIQSIKSHEQSKVSMEGASKVKMRMLIGPAENAPNFHMRQFEVEPGGHTPHHEHDFEHEVLILKGEGIFKAEDGDKTFKAGDVVWVPGGEKHQFQNTGLENLEFICLIPAPKE